MKLMHYNYLISGKITEENEFPENGVLLLFNIINEINPFLSQKINLKTDQFFSGKSKIKFGKLIFDSKNIDKIINYHKTFTEYKEEIFKFMFIIGSSPSLEISVRDKTTPELYFIIESLTKESANIGMIISIREDIFEKILKEIVEQVLKSSSKKFEIDKLKIKKRYFYGGSKVGSIMDKLPCTFYENLSDKWEDIIL